MFDLERTRIVTQDYQAGISPSVLDAIPASVIVVGPKNYKWIFKYDWRDIETVVFLGHDFLWFLWDKERKIKHWKQLPVLKIVWCFEKVQCVVPEWRKISLKWYENVGEFADHVFVADEEDYRTLDGVKFLPQWASPRFKNDMSFDEKRDQVVFSGQFGTVGYERRTELIQKIKADHDLGLHFVVSNNKRSLSWNDYILNLQQYKYVLNPIGNLISFNTRAYESVVAGNVLFQQVDDRFQLHKELLIEGKEVVYFSVFEDFKEKFLALRENPQWAFEIHVNAKREGNRHTCIPRLEWVYSQLNPQSIR